MLLNDGSYIDDSWPLTVFIDILGIEKHLRVQGNWAVSKVVSFLISQLPAKIPETSDLPKFAYAECDLWWPSKNKWLLHSGQTLFQAGLHADTWLRFTPSVGKIKIQLPDSQFIHLDGISFNEPVFRVTKAISKFLGVRHPEELGLQKSPKEIKCMKNEARPVSHRRAYASLSLPPNSRMTDTLPTLARKVSTLKRTLTVDGNMVTPKSLVQKGSLLNSNFRTDSIVQSDHPDHTLPQRFGPPKLRSSFSTLRICRESKQNFRKSTPFLSNSYLISGIPLYAGTWASLPSIAGDTNLEGQTLEPNMPFIEPPLNQITKSFKDRCKLSVGWLDSTKSLMEQGIDPFAECAMFHIPFILATKIKFPRNRPKLEMDCNTKTDEHIDNEIACSNHIKYTPPKLLLRFKYCTFYDLNPQFDFMRINLLYEQARQSIITQNVQCTKDEAVLLAAYQLQVSRFICSQRFDLLEKKKHATY